MANDPFAWTLATTLGVFGAVITVAVVSWLIGDDNAPPQGPQNEVDSDLV
jgi:hypothetical protein